jgi:tetratricopeptide (TPR) repeat protein
MERDELARVAEASPQEASRASNANAEPVQQPLRIPTLDRREGVDPLVLEAVDEAVEEIERDPRDGNAWGRLGRLYQATQYFALARSAYQGAAAVEPLAAEWPYLLGVDAARMGNHDEAIELFRRSLVLDPDLALAYLRIGDAQLAQDELSAAEDSYREFTARVAKVQPDQQAWGLIGLGKVARRQGAKTAAAGHLERALALVPQDRQATYLLAQIYRELDRSSEAQELLAALPPRDGEPDDPILLAVKRAAPGLQNLARRANQLFEQGNLAEAARLYEEVLSMDPQHYLALVNLGNVHGRQGRPREALALLRKAVALEPSNPHGRYGLALALLSLSNQDAAATELGTVLELDPAHRPAAELLARLAPPPR